MKESRKKEKIKKGNNKKENKINRNHMPIFLLGGLILICAILIIFYYMALRYAPISTIMYEGYGIEAKIVTKNLKSENFESAEQAIPLIKVEEQETIYEKRKSYYVGGKEKKNIDIVYPIYVNGKSALLNISEDANIITRNYEKVEGYENFMLAEGKLYNAHDLSKADNNEYILLETGEGTYVTTKEIKIQTEIGEYVIPVNSIIYFTEEYITYYEVEEDKLIYNNILEIDGNSKVAIETMEEISYEDFLKKLGIIEENPEIQTKPEEEKDDEATEGVEGSTGGNSVGGAIEGEGTENEGSEGESGEQAYIRPTITAEEFEARVYTAKTNIQINDPQGRITEAIFVVTRNNKTYQRRQILSSGILEITGLVPETEFEIEGQYKYYNEQNQEVQETFYKGKIKTGTIKDLGSIKLEHEPGEIYSNKVEIKNFKIGNDINDEVVKGISKIEIEIDGIKYKLSNSDINKLKNGETINYKTSETVKSDQKVTYKIQIYDKQGNELKVENGKGKTRTSKAIPSVRVQMKTQEVHITEMTIKLDNKDNVKLENYYYVILDNKQEIIRGKLEQKDKEITRTDLDPNGYYRICFYADYDLDDEKGIRRNNKIGEATFTTMPLASLGNLYWNTAITELEPNRAVLSIQIDEMKTDKRLIQLIDYIELIVKDKEENIIYNKSLDKEKIKAEEIILQELTGLNSNTEYNYEINTRIKQGSVEEQAEEEQTGNSFITKKKPAKVLIKNQFVTGEIIDFDVKIQDEDGAVLTNSVRLEIRDRKNNIIILESIKTNGEYERKQYNKLEENETYTIAYYADQYNEGSDNSTYEQNYEIYREEVITEMGINGELKLHSVSKKGTGKNLINVASEVNWVSRSLFNSQGAYTKEYNAETGILTITGNQHYVYDLREYSGQTVTLSFSAMLLGEVDSYYIWVQNGKEAINQNYTRITNLSNTEWKEYQYTLQVDETGYVGFNVVNSNYGLNLKNVQIELGDKKTRYEEFAYQRELEVSVNLEDKKQEIVTNDYYIRIYENNNLIKEERYEEIGENHKVENAIKTFSNLKEGTTCRIELLVKIRDRYYTLDYYELEIKKEDEIKAISNEEEFLEIQPYGHYIVVNDLDFTGRACCLTGAQWHGVLDFNGHTLVRDIKSSRYLFNRIGEQGIVENLVYDIKLNNENEVTNFYRNFC